MDKQSQAQLTFQDFNDCAVQVWEWVSDFISHFMMDVIIYRFQDFKDNPC